MRFYDIFSKVPTVFVRYGFRFVKKDEVVRFEKSEDQIGVFISSEKPLRYVRITWDMPEFAKDAYVLGDAFERGYGDLFWGKPEGRKLFWYAAFSDKVKTFAYGVKTGCSAICYWEVGGDGLSLVLDVQNGTLPVKLGSRVLHACDIVQAENEDGESVFSFMRRFCRIMCPKPRLASAPVYGTNTWYYAFTSTSYDLVKKDVELLDECTKGLKNRPYMVVDDGWELTNMNRCRFKKIDLWQPTKQKFPEMKEVTDFIKSHDQKPGIWIRYLLGSDLSPRSWRMPTLLFPDNIALDPSRPEVLRYVKDLTARIRGWGFELIKHDFSTFDVFRCYGSDYYRSKRKRKFFDRTKTTAEIILNFYKTIREAAGDAVVIGCNTVSHLSAGLFELERIGDDTSPKYWDRVVKMGVNSLAFRACQHNAFYGCDADCVGHTGEIPWEKNKQWLELLAVSGTPLFTSIDPRKATDEIKDDLKKAYALAEKQEIVAEPTTWFDDAFPQEWKRGDEEYKFDFSR